MYNFQTSTWYTTSRITYFTDSMLYENYTTNNGWVKNAAVTTIMGVTKPLSIREYYTNGSNLVFNKRYTYQYHNSNENYLLHYLYENPLPFSEINNSYDSNNNIIQTDESSYANGNYLSTKRTINHYSNNLLTKQQILNINLNTLITDTISNKDIIYENGQIKKEVYKLYNSQTKVFELSAGAYINNYYYKTSVITGIKNIFQETQLQLFPNPSNGTFNLTNANSFKTIKAFDLLGKEVGLIQLFDNTFSLNNKGVYFIQIQTEQNQTVTKRLIIH